MAAKLFADNMHARCTSKCIMTMRTIHGHHRSHAITSTATVVHVPPFHAGSMPGDSVVRLHLLTPQLRMEAAPSTPSPRRADQRGSLRHPLPRRHRAATACCATAYTSSPSQICMGGGEGIWVDAPRLFSWCHPPCPVLLLACRPCLFLHGLPEEGGGTIGVVGACTRGGEAASCVGRAGERENGERIMVCGFYIRYGYQYFIQN